MTGYELPPLPAWAEGLAFARPVMAAGVLFVDGAGRVLLVRPSYKAGWDLPGGIVEPGESPRTAATRELTEELGSALPFGRLLTVDWRHDDEVGDLVIWLFDGGRLTPAQRDAVRVDGVELLEAAWHDPGRVPELCPEPLALRIATALHERARADGTHVYAENGRPEPGVTVSD